MDRSGLALVIPALNEADRIAEVVAACAHFGTVIVVDDGSQDATATQARSAGAVVVSHAVNKGYDAALNSGFAEAVRQGCTLVITLDADGQHDPALVTEFRAALDAGADVVAGVRATQPRLSEKLFARLAHWRYGVADPMCGMKGYRMEIWQALGHFDSYGSIGSELLLHAVSSGARVVERPVPIRPRSGQSRFGGSLRANGRILRAMCIGFWRYSRPR
jgi:glycosyltransferase involved in cell wall biosynthesis